MLPPPAAIPKPPRETTNKKYLPAVKTKPRLSLEQSRWPLSRRATDNQKYKIPSHSLIALAQSRGRRRDGQKNTAALDQAPGPQQGDGAAAKNVKMQPGSMRGRGICFNCWLVFEGILIRGIRLAVGFLDGLAVPDRNANVTEFQNVFHCFLQRSLGPRRA